MWGHRLPLIAKWTSYTLCILTAIEGFILYFDVQSGWVMWSDSQVIGIRSSSNFELVLIYGLLMAILFRAGQYFANLNTAESTSKIWVVPTAIVLFAGWITMIDIVVLFI